MKTTLCTLYEGHYHYGVAALVNSLLTSGFTGQLWAGYRGGLADWIVQHPGWDASQAKLQVSESFSVHFVHQDTPVFFTYYKAHLMRDVFQRHAPDSDTVAYIDPDIVVKCNWDDIGAWFQGGLGLIEDVNWNIPARHPRRLRWKSWFAQHGIEPKRPMERYYNAGFLSVPREHADFLELLDRMCMLVYEYNSGIQHIKAGGAGSLFHSTDQDAMNHALSVYEAPLNTAAGDAMDFAAGGFYFSHAIGSEKPWLGRHLRRALKGRPPSPAMKAYYRFANHPIRVFPPFKFALRRLSLQAASAIGRFYRNA
jgi:hypothetical protein